MGTPRLSVRVHNVTPMGVTGVTQLSFADLGPAGGPATFPTDDASLRDWHSPSGHPYLEGTLLLARAFKKSGGGTRAGRIFVIGELSEELGSFRGRIAWQLDRHVFKTTRCRALTGDIGLKIVLSVSESEMVPPV